MARTVVGKQQALAGAGEEFERLLAIMTRLRSAGGCPWDAEQTHESLVRYLIEETYEVVEAIEADNCVNRTLLKEELGDVLLQVVFHSQIASEAAEEAGGFTVVDVLRGLNHKLERRHPHVFGNELSDSADVRARWEDLKREEKPERTGAFDGIPPQLPALAFAEKTVSRARRFESALPVDVEQGVTGEFRDEKELGEALFGLVAVAQAQGFDPERALRKVTRGVIEGN